MDTAVLTGGPAMELLSEGLGAPHVRADFDGHSGTIALARDAADAFLTSLARSVPPGRERSRDDVLLVVSELVTNAIVHTASSHVVCELHDDDDRLRIAVRDEGCAPGRPRANLRQQPEEEHGRGLLLVDALCHAWGAHEHGPGLLVWAELPRTAGTPPGSGEPRGDLGWGARSKPGPAGGSEDGEGGAGDGGRDHPAEQRLRTPAERDGGQA